MTQTVFEKMKTAISVLKLDFTTEEFATFAHDQESTVYKGLHKVTV